MLAEHLMREPLSRDAKVLDLCTGSGLLAILAAGCEVSVVVAVDVSQGAVLTTKANARLNGAKVRARRGDLFASLGGERFDLIVSNPPYVPSSDGRLPRHGRARAWEAGRSGRAFLDRICVEAPAHLKPGGVLLLVHSSVCGEEQTVATLTDRGLDTGVVDRARGRLGPRLRARADWLRKRGVLSDDGREEMLIIRARRPDARSL